MPGVTLTLTVSGSSVDFKATTDAEGRFTFHGVAPGAYDLLATMPGFISLSRRNILIGEDDVELPEIVLNIGLGCAGGLPTTGLQQLLLRIKRFFAPIDYSKVTICQ